ncbi:uridine kinase [Aureitalea marina]|uniref:Uridine kinase n=1 Tax=Aureitalea marina TaxID=930804 RepID=A0A2S7KPZ2_9FLAO|nr:uridine kinase [Aureitalea marina]PQB04681.1 uridine kinase [Aureitalea marina]
MLVIGVAGGTGSGKTTVVQQIVNDLPAEEVGVISQDSYYKDLSQMSYDDRCQINFDHPDSIDFQMLIQHIKSLKGGKSIQQPVYSFAVHNRLEESTTIEPRKVLIVEGILILSQPELRKLLDLKLYVYAESDERLIRRLKRDIVERGRDLEEVIDRYQNTLRPMHNEFIEPSKEFADVIIPTHRRNRVAVELIRDIIDQRIAQDQ